VRIIHEGDMMILIQNIGGPLDGVSKYSVQINNEFICEFEHNRMDGLGMCLLEASKAVERTRWKDAHDMLMKLEEYKDG
jgi:hypothetical protein